LCGERVALGSKLFGERVALGAEGVYFVY